VSIKLRVPEWIDAKVALLVGPEGVETLPLKAKRGQAEVEIGDLEACKLVVLANDAGVEAAYKQRFSEAIEAESREF
jgi:hypothetical protein